MESAHAKRWITALVAVPALVLLVTKGGRVSFSVLVALVAAVGLLEYFRLTQSKGTAVVRVVGLILGVAIVAAFFVTGLQAIPVLLVAAFLSCAVVSLATFDSQISTSALFFQQISGLIYIPLMLGHLILIRDWHQGITWTFFLLAVVFAGDTAAFYVGRAMGRHKLAPKISPGKTVEGALGGLAASLLIGLLFKIGLFQEGHWGDWVTLLIVLALLGQTGDLFESMLKRSVQVKDSGGIMPGHGGLLDRIDGLIFAAPGLYYWRTYFL